MFFWALPVSEFVYLPFKLLNLINIDRSTPLANESFLFSNFVMMSGLPDGQQV